MSVTFFWVGLAAGVVLLGFVWLTWWHFAESRRTHCRGCGCDYL